MENWAGNHRYQAARIHHPRSVDEVCEIVRASRRVRALGTRHSFNPIADCPDADLICLKNLNHVVGIDTSNPDTPTVTVEGGITYGQLGPILNDAGYALHNLASLPHISVAGACATTTHGSGDRNPVLSAAVVGMTLVSPAGELIEVSPQTHPDDFDGMVVGLGALGPVVYLKLKLQPRFDIAQQVYLGLPMAQLDEHLDAITGAAYSVSLFTDWSGPHFNQVWLKHRVTDGQPIPVERDFFGATPANQSMHPLPEISAEPCTQQLGAPGPWHERLPHFRLEHTPSNGVELQSEYLIPREHAAEALHTLNAMRDRITPLIQVTEVRTVSADNFWMSPCCGRDCVGIHFTWTRDVPGVTALLPDLEARLIPLQARPHWGKLFAMRAESIHEAYGDHLTRFTALLERFDPAGKFRNPFLEERLLNTTS